MRLYTRIDTPERIEKFKKIAIKVGINWYDGNSVDEFMPDTNMYKAPLAILVDTRNHGHLEHCSETYFKSHDEYVHIKLSQLEMVLEELL